MAAWYPAGVQLDLRTVDLGGPVTYAELGGSGRPIVCVHGLGGNILNWVVLAPLLGRLGRVVALDLPGFGRSPLAGRSTRIGDQARVLARFLGHIGQPAMLLGSSMGGLIALQVAAAQVAIDRLVLLAPAQPPPRGTLRRTPPAMIARGLLALLPGVGELMWRGAMRRPAEEQLAATMRLVCHQPSRLPAALLEAQRTLLAERARRPESGTAFLQATRSVALTLMQRRRYADMVAAVRVPTLLIQGRQDKLVSLEASRAMARARPDFTLHEIDDVGHVPQMELPEAVMAALEAWLA